MPVIFRTGGGGSALNFKVKAYAELPETGSENEIAVITNTPITGYALQAEEPTKSGTAGDTLTWDGNADGLEAVGTFVKVASCTLTVADFANGCSVSLSDGTVLTCTKADIEEMGGVIAISSLACYIPVDGFDAGEENPVSKGLYFNTEEREGVYVASITINGYEGFPATISEGYVWVQLGSSSIAPIWVDKKKTVRVYPVTMMQYKNGVWEVQQSYVYHNGNWADFGRLFLYQEGDERESLTGGWTGDSVTLNSNSIKFGGTVPANTNWYCRTENLVSVQNKKTLVFDLDVSKLGNTSIISTLRVGLSTSAKPSTTTSNYAAYMNIPVESYGTLDRQELEIDISELNGDYYPIIYIRNGNAATAQDAVINIYNVYLK